VTGILTFADTEPIALRWAEVVPLWFVREWASAVPAVFLSQPLRRYNESPAMVPGMTARRDGSLRVAEGCICSAELLALGGRLFDILNSIEVRPDSRRLATTRWLMRGRRCRSG
jgi:hypothetical protein